MIHYDSSKFVANLFRLSGSSLTGAGPKRALVSGCLAVVLSALQFAYQYANFTRDSTAFNDTLVIANIFMGLLMSFRLNSAFQQWKAGVSAIVSFTDTARSFMSSVRAFCDHLAQEDANKSSEIHRYLLETRRLLVLYTTIVFHDCRGTNKLRELKDVNLVTEEEYHELVNCNQNVSISDTDLSNSIKMPYKLQSTAVGLWLRSMVDYALHREILISQQAMALNVLINQLSSHYHSIFTISHIPIPFNYTNFLNICITLYLFLYGCVIVNYSGWFTPVWVFMWSLILFCADEVANEIECPFGFDLNDINLEEELVRLEDEFSVISRNRYSVANLLLQPQSHHPPSNGATAIGIRSPSGKTKSSPKSETSPLVPKRK